MREIDAAEKQRRWEKDIGPYMARGLKCELWGHPAEGMNRHELLAFVGMLDESVEALKCRLEK